jgi:hypothetical protein
VPLPFRLRHAEWARGWVAERGITVGVHVRRGDKVDEPWNNVASAAYYAAAVARLKEIRGGRAGGVGGGELLFVVCTDDPLWVREQVSGASLLRPAAPGRAPPYLLLAVAPWFLACLMRVWRFRARPSLPVLVNSKVLRCVLPVRRADRALSEQVLDHCLGVARARNSSFFIVLTFQVMGGRRRFAVWRLRRGSLLPRT